MIITATIEISDELILKIFDNHISEETAGAIESIATVCEISVKKGLLQALLDKCKTEGLLLPTMEQLDEDWSRKNK